jgi:hypothetical protein
MSATGSGSKKKRRPQTSGAHGRRRPRTDFSVKPKQSKEQLRNKHYNGSLGGVDEHFVHTVEEKDNGKKYKKVKYKTK